MGLEGCSSGLEACALGLDVWAYNLGAVICRYDSNKEPCGIILVIILASVVIILASMVTEER